MVDINSPLGRRQLAMQQNQRKVLTVPDESMEVESTSFDDSGEFEPNLPPAVKRVRQMMNSEEVSREELIRARQEAKQSKFEVTPKARNRIDILLGLKRKTKDVVVEGVKFTLRSLKHSEYQDIFLSLSKLSDASNIVVSLEMQIQSLARSISHIDDSPIAMVLGVTDTNQILDHLREFESDVIDQLYEGFKSLKDKTEIKSEEESEVAEDLKK